MPPTDRHTVTLTRFCQIVGMAAERFRTHRRRGELPLAWLEEWDSKEEDAYRGWTRFSPRDALAVRCAYELSENDGLSFADAARIVRNCGGLGEVADGTTQGDYWIGAAEYKTIGRLHTDDRGRGHFSGGDFNELQDFLFPSTSSRRHDPYSRVARVFIVNAALVYDLIKERALQAGYRVEGNTFIEARSHAD